MKKKSTFFALFLGLMSTSIHADWIEVARHADQSYVAYLDPASKKATPNGYTVWKMRDYLAPQRDEGIPYQYLSDKALSEYDCAHHKVRELTLQDYAGHRAAGSPLNASQSEGSWQRIIPGSIGEATFLFVCQG
jgi:hypothetical protein